MTAWFWKEKSQVRPPAASLDAEAIANKLKAFIAGKSKLVAISEIDEDTKIFSSGLIDSLVFIELVLFIEREFAVKLSGVTEVTMNSLDSIRQIREAVVEAASGGAGRQ